MDLTNPMLLFALALITIFCLRLLMSPDSRGRARGNLVTLARQRPAVQAVVAVLFWIASVVFAVDVVVHFAIQAPEALSLIYKLGSIVSVATATIAGLIWVGGAKSVSFFPPDGDRRLSAEAQLLGISTEEVVMRILDAGLPQLKPEGD